MTKEEHAAEIIRLLASTLRRSIESMETLYAMLPREETLSYKNRMEGMRELIYNDIKMAGQEIETLNEA